MPTGYLLEKLDPEIRTTLASVRSQLSSAGHAVVDVAIPHAHATPDIYLHIVLPEASHYHAATLESDPSGYSPGVRLRLEMGRYLLAEDYVRAMRLRAVLTAGVDAALAGCDALLLPTLPVVAPILGSSTVDVDGRLEPVRAATLRLTQMFNLTGHPAIALPAGRNAAGLPISMQLVAERNRTDQLLAVAAAVERQITVGFGIRWGRRRMNIGTLLGRGLRRSDRIGHGARRFDDVRLLRQIRSLRLLDHALIRAIEVPAT